MHDERLVQFGADVLLQYLHALLKEEDGVRAAADSEYLHRMRVASRRLRAALTIFAPCLPRKTAANWQRSVRRVTRALGAARDTDVQIAFLRQHLAGNGDRAAHPGLQRLLLRLRQRRAALQPAVLRALDRLAASRLPEEMGQVLGPALVSARYGAAALSEIGLFAHAATMIGARLAEMLAFEPAISDPARVEELHGMRIAAKRLRYTIEIFAPLYAGALQSTVQGVKTLQGILGDIHDRDVWIAWLPHFLDDERARALDYYGHTRPVRYLVPGLAALEACCRHERDTRYQQFLELWAKKEQRALWKRLPKQVAEAGALTEGGGR